MGFYAFIITYKNHIIFGTFILTYLLSEYVIKNVTKNPIDNSNNILALNSINKYDKYNKYNKYDNLHTRYLLNDIR
jgi:hypothetical protein